MAVLNAEDRRGMPSKDFAGPGKSFPISDPTHARMAISGATRSEHAGNISPEEEARIKAKARAKLGGKSAPPESDHKAAVAKMNPEHLHKLVQHAASGKAGPEMQQMAQQAMQSPADHQEPDGDEAMPPRRSMFSGEPDGDEQQQQEPVSRGSMFSGGR
jgi:hypothetical protein